MIEKYKFAVMILYFDCEQFILKAIDNCAPFVDKIYILYSELPYSKYNINARSNFRNTARLEILKESKYHDNVEIIEGIWETEEDQRNECLQKAKAEGFDFLIVQDADEFYLPEDYKKNIQGMIRNPDYTYYQVPWILFWKNTKYILQYRKHGIKRNVTITDCPVYAVNLRKDVIFRRTRILADMDKPYKLDGLCYHLSWVLSDEEVLRKISTWSHADQVKPDVWYKWKWQAWEPSTRNIGVIGFIDIKKAVPYDAKLPLEISSLPNLTQQFIPLSKIEKFLRYLNDLKYFTKLLLKWPYYLVKYRKNIL
ncbi:MAG: hypothetical protein B6D44_01200 [Ignavibacteriales bacterium UTCHB2]|jgi:hypothetical protein|nr:MAG: hypothetical protein B6D44_01200 [Ignavibacteriales bacterium UTCHB2]